MTRYRVAIIGTGPYVQLPSRMYDSFVKWLLPKLLWSKVADDLAPQQPRLSQQKWLAACLIKPLLILGQILLVNGDIL